MKKYFRTDIKDPEFCYTLDGIKDQMRFEDISELEVVEAVPIKGSNFFFCTYYGEIGEVGESCGSACDSYKPRNNKNGRCVSSGSVYEPSDRVRLVKL